MITEAYVSFETAKLLKENGFNVPCRKWYTNNMKPEDVRPWEAASNSVIDDYCSMPTQAVAMRWLREVHNKHCDVGYDIDLGWFFQIIDLKETANTHILETKCPTGNDMGFSTYEEAVEAALKYALEDLI